jgi:hypothetical protein
MGKWFFNLILLLVLISAAEASEPEPGAFRLGESLSPETPYAHLEYFGFYASAMGRWNFTEELAPVTNLTWVHVGAGDSVEEATGKTINRLRQARDAGVQATLSLEHFLFLNKEGEPKPESEIEDFLVDLRARIEHENLLDHVAMLYPKDEPFREFVRHRDPPFHEQYITGEVYEEIHEDLVHVNRLIKLVFPDKPIGVILSGYELTHLFFSIPENYDWVGFDCYDDLYRSCDNRSFVRHYAHLLEHMQPHQRLIAVPETWALNEVLGRADWPDVLSSRLRHHYEIALSEPRFVAFVPFIWSFDADGDVPGLGLNRFAELFDDGVSDRGTAFVEEVMLIGQQIKEDRHAYPNMSWDETEDSRHRPASNIRGEIDRLSRGGRLSGWAINDALPHKNLRVQVLVRDARGRLIHESAPERTFVRKTTLGDDEFGSRVTGLHGYRYQIPKRLLHRNKGRVLHVDLVIYADGDGMDIGSIQSRKINVR